jgi:hypothetical protein
MISHAPQTTPAVRSQKTAASDRVTAGLASRPTKPAYCPRWLQWIRKKLRWRQQLKAYEKEADEWRAEVQRENRRNMEIRVAAEAVMGMPREQWEREGWNTAARTALWRANSVSGVWAAPDPPTVLKPAWVKSQKRG